MLRLCEEGQNMKKAYNWTKTARYVDGLRYQLRRELGRYRKATSPAISVSPYELIYMKSVIFRLAKELEKTGFSL